MRKFLLGIVLTGSFGLIAADLKDPSEPQVADIIAKFAAKEAEFQKARSNYTYRQTAKVMNLDEGGGIIGKWEEVTDIVFTPEGKRAERVVRAPVTTLVNFSLDPGDLQDHIFRRRPPRSFLPSFRIRR